jgi:hypothetical protein
MKLFSEDSWWNQPIPPDPYVYPQSEHWMDLQQDFCKRGLHLNLSKWTIPVVTVDNSVPRVKLNKLFEMYPREWWFLKYAKGDHPFGHGPGIEEGVPIPPNALTDPMEDAHLCIINTDTGQAWDMWCARQLSDGSWGAFAACTYNIHGDGLLTGPAYEPVLDESIHLYGPSRAAGVPIPAGLLFRDEVESGEIHHKLAWSCEFVGRHAHVFPPAIWTDGWYPDGLPEGSVLQLDPGLDLTHFNLSPGARTVARALQTYGAALVDYGTGGAIYAELGTPDEWSPLLIPTAIDCIPYQCYRVVRLGEDRVGGDIKSGHLDHAERIREMREGL